MILALSAPLGVQGQPVPSESTISTAVTPLTQLLEDCASSSTTIKKMLHSYLESVISRTLELLPYVIRCQSICEVLLGFLHSAFSVLQQQLGPEFMQNAVQGMLQIYTRFVSRVPRSGTILFEDILNEKECRFQRKYLRRARAGSVVGNIDTRRVGAQQRVQSIRPVGDESVFRSGVARDRRQPERASGHDVGPTETLPQV